MDETPPRVDLSWAAALIDAVPTGMAVVDADDRVLIVNDALRRAFGVPGGADIVGVTCAELGRREAFRPAAALLSVRAVESAPARQRFALPDGRLLEGTWHRLPADAGPCGSAGVVASGAPDWLLTVVDVTGDALVRRRLRQHNRALAELVATKTELVSALLHEVRTPLTAARSMIQLLPESFGDPLTDEMRRGVGRNLDRLGDVVDDIATVGGIESGAVDLDSAPISLPDLLTQAVAKAGEDITLTVTSDPTDPPVRGDSARLAEVFDRLILAARVVTGGAVRVRVDTSQQQWRVAFALPDRGAADRLFTTTGARGNATALMFARAVVGRNGGDVGISSRDGTPHLVVRLPFAAETRSEQPVEGIATTKIGH